MKTILLLSFVFVMGNSFCQTTPGILLTKTDYLQKSKNQRKTGLILLASGTTLATIGTVKLFRDTDWLSPSSKEANFWATAAIVGLISDVVGAGFLRNSHKNKVKAAKLSVNLGTQPLLLPQQNSFVITAQPAVTLKINIGD